MKTYTVKEISDLLGISPQAVRAKCRRQDGSLIASLERKGKKRIPTWIITGGSLLRDQQEEQPPLEEEQPPLEGEQPPLEEEQPVAEDPEVDEWERIREELNNGSYQREETQEEESPPQNLHFTPEKLLSFIKAKMPAEMFKRNEILIEIWCQLAPGYMDLDVQKLGKIGFYGIPAAIVVSEAALAKKKKAGAGA